MEKTLLQQSVRRYIESYPSQNKAAASLGVSSATLTNIVGAKWELLSEEMLRTVASKVGYSAEKWVNVNTRTCSVFNELLTLAKTQSQVFGVIADAGRGKSHSTKLFREKNPNVYRLECSEYWNRKTFMGELLKALGKDSGGYSVGEIMNVVVSELKRQDRPLIILDEADKLNDQVLYFFISLYNMLEDRCGIVICGTDFLEKRITRGLRLNKRGYKEIYSRIGRRFVELPENTKNELKNICTANGIVDADAVTEIINESEFDIRRIKRKITALKLD